MIASSFLLFWSPGTVSVYSVPPWIELQGDQLHMAVYFWYHVEIDLSNEYYCTKANTIAYIGAIKTRPCLSGHPVGTDMNFNPTQTYLTW